MSTSINEAIGYAEERLASLHKIKKRYPEAKLDRGLIFYVDGGKASEPDCVLLLDNEAYLAEKVGNGYIKQHWPSVSADQLLRTLLENPTVLKVAMGIVRGDR